MNALCTGKIWSSYPTGARPTMPKKKYLVTLTDDERTQLEDLLRGGHAATRKVTRARIAAQSRRQLAGCAHR